MAVIQLNNTSLNQSESTGFGSGNVPGGDASRSSNTRTTTGPALHEGGIILSGGRTVDFQAAERFRILRARIERLNLSGDQKNVIAVTSAVPEEGKSLIASNLARALALDPRGKTLLIDCDLRKPSVHRYFGLPFSPGLSDALVGNRSLASVVQTPEPGLDVITAGSPVIDATRAVELPQLATMFQELKKHYRYIIVDCPPVLLCPEPIILSSLVDGTLMVVRAWHTHKKLVRDAVRLIGKEKFVGVVVNDAQDALNEYGYYGYYGYDNRSSRGKKPNQNLTSSPKPPISTNETLAKMGEWGKGVVELTKRGKRENKSVAFKEAGRGILLTLGVLPSRLVNALSKKAVSLKSPVGEQLR